MNKTYIFIIILLIIIGFPVIFYATKNKQKGPDMKTQITQTPQGVITQTPEALGAQTDKNQNNASDGANIAPEKGPFPMSIDVNKIYYVTLHTDAGDMKIELNPKSTPVTINNFINLTQRKFYDGTIFHRVIKGFMIQGGDPEGTGRGGPGYQFNDESFSGEYTRGTVAMANAGPNTNGSQFFIMHADYQLPKNYVIFGKVIDGLDTLDKIANSPVVDNGMGEVSKPVKPVTVKQAEVSE